MASPSDPMRVGVIMAGGSGERFWPLSRANRPKQLLPLAHPSLSMLEQAIERVQPLIPPEQIFVVTSQSLVGPIRDGKTGLPPENIFGEPSRRNTSGCLAYAAAHLLARYGADPASITMAVITADHDIHDTDGFRATVKAAVGAAERADILALIGIKPDRPETGYGYIEIAPNAAPLAGSDPERPVLPVARFREKPDLRTAERFLETGRCYWNSGMFFWRLSSMLKEAELACPAWGRAIEEMAGALRQGDETRVQQVFDALDDLPIDIVLVERSNRVAAAVGAFDWDDVGSWDAIRRRRPLDAQGNVAIGDPVLVDAKDCVVYNQSGAEKMAVAVIGVEDLAVVVTADAVLVVPRGQAQDIKRAVAELRRRGAPQL